MGLQNPILLQVLPEQVQLSSAPGLQPQACVGSIEWLSLWFPVREGNITISLSGGHLLSFPEQFLKDNFDFFRVALDSPMKEAAEGKILLGTVQGPSFGLIIAFLMVGTFPKPPCWGASQSGTHITNCLNATVAADFLQMKQRRRLVDFLKLEVRHMLAQHRDALWEAHIDLVFMADSPPASRPFLPILVQAGVRPSICHGLTNATNQTINSSGNAKQMGVSVDRFKSILHHFNNILFKRDTYFFEVSREAHSVRQASKRLNHISTDSPANKHMRNLPEEVVYVTYQDPLTQPLGLPSIFTS